ncbi:MAG: 5-(carboxyamino)imidazole ribonucleotide synthase, partial [Brevundimonas sp.]|uniref:5-(carboxyamino)imidazole ribonucleotide synthase n=1 Tax=Brevundimonas sp. TaxID=1871086 RepID=UPI0027355E20
MLSQAAARLGFDVVILDPEENSPAGRVSRGQIVAAYDDPTALNVFGRVCDVVTFEFENVPAASVERLAEAGALVAPGPVALAVAQDRVEEKTFLNAVGAPTVAFAAIDSLEDLTAALQTLGTPGLLKTRRDGYDGKGQVWIKSAKQAATALASLGGRPAILEARADFTRELSIIAARGRDGAIAVYPLGQNHHAGGVLRTTHAPAAVDAKTERRARAIATAVLEGLAYVGVIGIELFDLGDGKLLVNEIAPRVHNTGHWTQDGCVCDQFEQHIRAI